MQDGNIHCHIDNLARRNTDGNERIAVATAAYNAGERLWSEREQRHVDFKNREDVVYSKIFLPEGAPLWAARRNDLWNRVDMTAKRRDARLAKSIEAAITRDIPVRLRPAFLEAFVAPFVALGCAADVAIHEDGTDHNPHVHILLTTRVLEEDGFGGKLVALEQRAFVKQVRKNWADLTNTFLEKTGSAHRVDHRSYKARGIGAEPTRHRGPNPTERRNKREHARRVREEKSMKTPDRFEREHYPLLSKRESWPPEPEASPDMTPQERDEHHRYWQDRKLDRLEAASLSEPIDADPPRSREHDKMQAEPAQSSKPWFEQALDKARGEHAETLKPEPVEPEKATAYERSVFERAQDMPVTREEQDVLNAVQGAPDDVRKITSDLIMQERMHAIREKDRAEQLRRLPTDVRERLEALRPEDSDRDRDLPVPGPNGELISPRERDVAYERMLDEYLREETEQERER